LKKQLKNKIRIKDIADMADVSIGTVDRVLHNRGEVAQSTKDHIMNIIKVLGYTPNLLAKSLASKKKYRITILIPDYKNDNPYWEKPLIGINHAASELKNYNFELVIYSFDLNNENSFWDRSKEVFESKPDGLIFAPVHYKASGQIVDKCERLNIPYVFFDVSIDNCKNLAFFGQNAFMSGFLAARLISYGLPDGADVLIIKLLNKSGANHLLDTREKGFTSFFSSPENKKNINICSLNIDMTLKEELNTGLDKAINYSQGMKGVFVVNSRVYRIARYLEEKNIQNLLLIGYDLLEENIHYLDKGIIQFLIGQKPEEQGYKSVMALFNHLMLNKTVDKINYSPIDIIMKENIDYYRNMKI
jgi:LacI family transcriptional regulator